MTTAPNVPAQPSMDVVKNLLSYTVEHQKITLTLATFLIAGVAYDLRGGKDAGALPTSSLVLFGVAVVAMALSAIAGGVVAANLAVMKGVNEEDDGRPWSRIERVELGLLANEGMGLIRMTLGWWRSLQHWLLWTGIGSAAVGGVLIALHR